jgi:hypothetical protein
LYHEKNWRQNDLACLIESKRAGNPGRHFSVLNCASEYGRDRARPDSAGWVLWTGLGAALGLVLAAALAVRHRRSGA